MLRIRKSHERGHNQTHWLDSYHSFSFGSYQDPKNTSFSKLRVINEDKIATHSGFDFHSHQNMEIITFMLEGSIEHQDSLGNKGLLTAGNVQLMRAGTGITHSEYNGSEEMAHLLQIWIFSERKQLEPGWWEKKFNGSTGLEVIVEPIYKELHLSNLHPELAGQGLAMAQNGYILKVSKAVELDFLKFGTSDIYFQQAKGSSTITKSNDLQNLEPGDAAMGRVESILKITPEDNSFGLLFVFPI